MRYRYLGDRWSKAYGSPRIGQACDPVYDHRGKCIVGGSKQVVTFADGSEQIVMRRFLRVVEAAVAG